MSNRDYRLAQQILWGDAGAWAHDTFTELNAKYFADEIPPSGIVWGLTAHGARLGHCHCDGRITLHPALLDPKSNAWGIEPYLGEAYAADVVLHEMIHALLFHRGVDAEHNGEPWCAEIVRLAPELGLEPIRAAPVVPRRIDGKVRRLPLPGHLDRKTIAAFPHPLRPKEYYRNTNGRLRIAI
jgi:SprT-like family